MQTLAPFGFVTGCYAKDKFLVQATLASIKHFCPEVPICLVVDGNFDVSDLVDQYNVIVLRIDDLPSLEMRQLIGGDYRAKLSAIWEGPFDFLVWLDSDAIIWGDIVQLVRTDVDFHIFWKKSDAQLTDQDIKGFKHYFFDPEKLKKFDANFTWRENTYFCSGAFACKKNAISFKEWLDIELLASKDQNLFAWGEMGMLNYAVHSKLQKGKLSIAIDDLQHLWVEHGIEELENDCKDTKWQFPKYISRPRIAHFCGQKPLLHMRSSYSKPFTIARLQHYRNKKYSNLSAWIALVREETPIILQKIYRRLSKSK